MSNWLQKVKAGIKNSTQVRWPGTSELLTIRVASKEELSEAGFAAEARFKRHDVEVAGHNHPDYLDEKNVQILFMVLSVAGKPVATSVDSFRALISQEELDELSKAYIEHERETSPNLDHLSEEKVGELLAELKKKPDEILGSVSSIGIARKLLRTMVAQLPS